MRNPSKNIKVVRRLLQNIPETRDNDMLLISMAIDHHFPIIKISNNYNIFLKYFISGQLPHFESIRRCRQKLQEEHPELRGVSYRKRKNISAPETRMDILDPQWKKGGTP